MRCQEGKAAAAMGYVTQCGRESEPGRTRCRKHLDAQATAQRRHREKKAARPVAERPAWMGDPSLLPKRPPTQRQSKGEP